MMYPVWRSILHVFFGQTPSLSSDLISGSQLGCSPTQVSVADGVWPVDLEGSVLWQGSN